MTTPFGYFDLLETLPQPGCAVCRLLQRDVERFLDTLLYEHTVDPPTQTAFRASRGLCHDHTWMLPPLNNALAVGILYDAVLDELIKTAARTPATDRQSGLGRLLKGGAPGGLAEALEAKLPCPACVVRDDAARRYLEVLGDYSDDQRLRPAFEQSDGLCLLHFRGVLALEPQKARFLVDVQVSKWKALKGELTEFLHKLDAHYHETMGAESTSWLRALARVAGEKGYQ